MQSEHKESECNASIVVSSEASQIIWKEVTESKIQEASVPDDEVELLEVLSEVVGVVETSPNKLVDPMLELGKLYLKSNNLWEWCRSSWCKSNSSGVEGPNNLV